MLRRIAFRTCCAVGAIASLLLVACSLQLISIGDVSHDPLGDDGGPQAYAARYAARIDRNLLAARISLASLPTAVIAYTLAHVLRPKMKASLKEN